MTNLTEQWKNGELPDGVYYCNTGYVVETLFTWGKNYHQFTNNKDKVYIPEMDDCEVLAPVPSYEELQELKEFADYSIHNRNELTRQLNFWMDKHTQITEENQKLKELLKECRKALNKAKGDTVWYPVEIDHVLTKIDEVLK